MIKILSGKVRERIVEPYWSDILMSIEAIENEVRTSGGVRDYGVYEESDASDTETDHVKMSLKSNVNITDDSDEGPPGTG